MVEYPADMPQGLPGEFDWSGFRIQEHRQTPEYQMEGFNSFGDWPNLTVGLAAAGYTQDELRKLLGLNYLRVFRDIVG
jgi:membrane dipeptidase